MKTLSKLPLIAVCLGFFMVVMDLTIVNVALPQLKQNLNSSISQLQWVVDGYTLTFACFLLTAGYFSDLFGAKKIYILGIGGFVITSLGCGLAVNIQILVLFRLLQGLSAASLMPTAVALINNSYTDDNERAKAIGIWASSGAIAAAAGPVLGGVLVSFTSWRAVFLVNVPVGLTAIYLTYKYLINTPLKPNKIHFDYLGQLLIIISIGALAFGLIEAPNIGWTSHLIISCFILFIITLILFIIVELKYAYPMIDINLFNNMHFSISAILGVLLNFGFYGFLFVMPLYLHSIKHFNTLEIGLSLLPLSILMFFGNILSGKLCSKKGPKFPALSGFIIATFGFFMLLISIYNDLSFIIMLFPLLLIGFALALIMPALTVMIVRSIPSHKAGFASATFNMSRQIGSLLGVAIIGTLINLTSNLSLGMNISVLITVICYGIGAIIISFCITQD